MTIKQYIFDYFRKHTFEINEMFELKDNDVFQKFEDELQREVNNKYSAWRDDGRNRYIKDNLETYWFVTKLNNHIMVNREGRRININWKPKITKL